MAAGIGGCGGGPRPAAAHSVTIAVSPSRPLRVTIPGVATVTGPAGSFRGHGTVTVAPVHVPLPYGGSLAAAGTGIDVRFSGVTLSRPLTITFDVTGRPGRRDVPVVAHRLPDGRWSLAVAGVHAGRMTVRAQTFSAHMPAWLNPGAWMGWLGNRLASLVGGRTPPINCPGGGPAWASVSKQTDEAHSCLIPNVDQASHATRAEVQIKSNRGVALEVDIPPGADYTWVQDQPWAVRAAVWGHVIHQDPSVMALLPAGATLTAGYRQPAADEDLSFQVNVSYWSMAYSLIGDAVDVLSSLGADATSMATLYLVTKCSGAVDYGSLSVHNPLSTATFGSAMTCAINEALSNLSSPAKALGAARSLLGPGVDQVDLAAATKELTSVGSKLLVLGWVVKLWPVLQLGWGGSADVVHSLLTGGASTLIGLRLRGGPAPPPPGSVTALTPGAGTPHATSGIVRWPDGYWFAVAQQQRPSPMTVTIYRWEGSAWVRQASAAVANTDGSLSNGGFDPSGPITPAAVTGAAAPDFLIHTFGADTYWLNVVSDVTGQWAAMPFDDSGGQTVGENEVSVSGPTITVGYDNCNPDCAGGTVTKVGFRYANGLFRPADPPGSCTGEALAQSAHAYALHAGGSGSSAITGVACAGGYAAANATNGNSGWAVTFRSTGNGWTVLASANVMSPGGIPPNVYQALKAGLSGNPQDLYYPY
jgi:hypothetical protein